MNWTVDYGEGEKQVQIPHVWGQDVPVWWEGPVVYRTSRSVENEDEWLVFEGVSYAAKVYLNGDLVCEHRGIWDAFGVDLGGYEGVVGVEVVVFKNGGERYPVKSVLSGFLPYVFQTFGGIFRPVRVVRSAVDPCLGGAKVTPRVSVEGRRLFLDGEPFFMRGVLTWGWYPEVGSPHPSLEECRRECRLIREMGFNTVKFCLWMPPHHFFEALREEGLVAWVELPLWDPVGDESALEAMGEEIRRIVRQYRHHPEIVVWTVGCELSESTPPEFREKLTEFVLNETGCPLVKDNSGGAEMYGGDIREFGTFEDFHPYCDLPFYRPVLESLRPGLRTRGPVLLGEFNDYDHVRDLSAVKANRPYWLSGDRDLNDQGVRWQHDFPALLDGETLDVDFKALNRFSISKGHFIRKRVHEIVRQTPEIAGYVVTGWRDTPISTSGMVDDALEPRYGPQHWRSWNSELSVGLLADRSPPWVDGGNRPGWQDPSVWFEGLVTLRVTVAAERGFVGTVRAILQGAGEWAADLLVEAGEPCIALDLTCPLMAGHHLLSVRLEKDGATVFEEPLTILVAERFGELPEGWGYSGGTELPFEPCWAENMLFAGSLPGNLSSVNRFVLVTDGSLRAPFWRECIFEYADPVLPFANRWELLFGVSGDRFLTDDDLDGFDEMIPLMTRLDTRTYQRSLVVARVRKGDAWGIVTTLRLWGGLGAQPAGYKTNAAGHKVLKDLVMVATG